MKEFIFAIFNAIAETAMEKGMSTTLRYENDQGESKTIISSSKRDMDTLTLSIYPVPKEDPDNEEDPDEGEDEEEEVEQ